MAAEKPEIASFSSSYPDIFLINELGKTLKLKSIELLRICHLPATFVSTYDIWQRTNFKMTAVWTGSTGMCSVGISILSIIAVELKLLPVVGRHLEFVALVDAGGYRRQVHLNRGPRKPTCSRWNIHFICYRIGVTNTSGFAALFKYRKCSHFRHNMLIVSHRLLVGLIKPH